MKPFIFTFIPLYLMILGVGFATIVFPTPGSDPMPAWLIRQEAMKNRIFEIIIFPAHWLGGSALFVGAAIWALLPPLAFAYYWRIRSKRRANLFPTI